MKTATLLVPLLLLSTAAAWGRDSTTSSSSSSSSRRDQFDQPAPKRRFDYKQSLKKPFQYNGELPFWTHHGNSFVALDFIRLTPSVPQLRGSVWRETPNEYKEWEVEFAVKAFGQSHIGGRGFAFWYTKDKETKVEGGGGPVFGSQDKWTGLGLFMDSSDPANQRTQPVVYGILNDGTKQFPSKPTTNSDNLGGCLRDYKSSPVPAVVRVSYIGQTLKISIDPMNKGKRLVTCFEQKDVKLPTGYYFGISAESALTGTPDDHDLFSFEVYEVNPPPRTANNLRPHEEEMIKKGKEVKVDASDKQTFEDVQRIVEEREQKIKEEKEGGYVISQTEIAAMVAKTQFQIIDSLNNVHNKLETLGAPAQPPVSTSKSMDEINQKLNNMATSLQTMQTVVMGLVDHIMDQGDSRSPHDMAKVLKEELKTLNAKMEDIDSRQSQQHQITQKQLVKSSSWVVYVFGWIAAQGAGFWIYAWYKKRLEYSEKKFI
ncbi:hypothetical protein BGW38_006505 [Lunasporangiospora selenospora]|uniref:L-type lectin-like domain-containing protein n=1 Tax=Lunasporangiospora selenospora TaxID=979761 RepID=A0A9P6FMT8_9FUNG|nr:hypothetical protein BGW38_006505 [Lunasporangiospora selenospora]